MGLTDLADSLGEYTCAFHCLWVQEPAVEDFVGKGREDPRTGLYGSLSSTGYVAVVSLVCGVQTISLLGAGSVPFYEERATCAGAFSSAT